MFDQGQRVRVCAPGVPDFARVRVAMPGPKKGDWTLFLVDDEGGLHEVAVPAADRDTVRAIVPDGGADSARVLAGMWTRWMAAAATNAESSAIASTQLRPYAHQTTAVYGAMLPQPLLRFLLADEPGTGKTIMAGLYLREMQRLGLVRRAIVVCPANLATKWVADFRRFFAVACANSDPAPSKRTPWADTTCGSCPWSSRRSTRRFGRLSDRIRPVGIWSCSTRLIGSRRPPPPSTRSDGCSRRTRPARC